MEDYVSVRRKEIGRDKEIRKEITDGRIWNGTRMKKIIEKMWQKMQWRVQ